MTNYHKTIREVELYLNRLIRTETKPMRIAELTINLRGAFGIGKRSLLNILKDYEDIGAVKIEDEEIKFLSSKKDRNKLLGDYEDG